MASKLKAKAKLAVRRRKEALRASESSLIERLLERVVLPTPTPGKDGRDAPELSTILEQIKPLLPESKVEQTTIMQAIDQGEMESMMDAMIEGKLPEMEKSLRPKVELIREDVSEEKLKGFVSKKELDDALKRVQDAITYHSGGGRPPDTTSLINLIEADQVSNIITVRDLDITKMNVVHATVAGSSIQLPKISPNYVVWVEDAVSGGGNLTITRET